MEKINLSKEDFLKIMKDISYQRNKIEEFNAALNKMCSGFPVFNSEDKYLEALIFLLSKTFLQTPNDELNTIEWYLYEMPDEENSHYIFYQDYEININTDELLYELLCAEYEQKANNSDRKMLRFAKNYGRKMSKDEFVKKHNIFEIPVSNNN